MPGEEVLAVTKILLKLLDHKDWQVRHGGLLGVGVNKTYHSSTSGHFQLKISDQVYSSDASRPDTKISGECLPINIPEPPRQSRRRGMRGCRCSSPRCTISTPFDNSDYSIDHKALGRAKDVGRPLQFNTLSNVSGQ